jgi:putative membrane protein
VNLLALVGVFLGLTVLGVLLGAVTGLAPGLHVNNVAALLLATRDLWAGWIESLVVDARSDPTLVGILLSAFLLATAASHSVFSFIPSVFLGAPTEDTALASLPGHRLLLAGKGAKAVALAARGAVLGTAFAVALLIPLRLLLEGPILLAERFRPLTAAFLVGLLVAILLSELRGRNPGRRILRSAWVQALAGILGIVTLRGAVPLGPNLALFPLFAGLFGLPTLFVSLRGPSGRIPPQTLESLRPLGLQEMGNALRGAAAGAAISWLPGLSGGVAATLASVGHRKRSGPTQFMVVLGAVSSSTALLSVAVLFMIQRTRSGVAAGVRVFLGERGGPSALGPVPDAILPLVVAAVLATALAAPFAVRLARRAARSWSLSDPRRISVVSLLVIHGLLFFVTGPVGLAVAGVATLVGLVPIAFRVRRIHLMASLLVPVLLTYLIPTS